MTRRPIVIAAVTAAALAVPAAARAHVSFHPNAIPAKSEVTTNLRVPNESDNANMTSVAIKLPSGIIEALGDPPAPWSFKAKTQKLAKPVKTDDGVVTTEVTEVDFTGGHTAPGEFVNLPLTMVMPDSAKQGSVLTFPTVETYSDGHVQRWIGTPSDDSPAPTVDITAPGTALLDVTGGDAGPPSKLPANLIGTGSSSTNNAASATSANATSASATSPPPVTRTIVKKDTPTLGIIAIIVGAIGLLIGLASLARSRAVVRSAETSAPARSDRSGEGPPAVERVSDQMDRRRKPRPRALLSLASLARNRTVVRSPETSTAARSDRSGDGPPAVELVDNEINHRRKPVSGALLSLLGEHLGRRDKRRALR